MDQIKLLNTYDTKYNMLLKMVISNLKTTNWVEFYGLNIIETMDLEFANYIYMVDDLIAYNAKLKTDIANAKLNILSNAHNQ